jgi:hypothetical protein
MEKAVTTFKDKTDNAEYDLCQKCLDRVLPILTGENKPGPKKKEVK